MTFSAEIERIVKRKLDRLESVPNEFLTAMEKIQLNRFKDVVSLLDQLDYAGGNLVLNETNLLRIEGIVEQVKDVLTGDEFESAVGKLMDEMAEQADITYSYFAAIDPAFEVPAIASSLVKARQSEAIASLLDSTNFYLTNPTRNAIADAIQTGASRQQLIETLRFLVQGDDEIDGRLLRSTRLVVSDAFAISDRVVTNEIADQLGLQWYLYAGGLLDTTRPFCKARNGKFFHRKEIESWASEDWSGKMANTDSKTIFVVAGGYNCQHSLLPVSEAVVPIEDRKRMKVNA